MTLTPVRSHVYRMEDSDYGTLFCLVVSIPEAELESTCVAVRVSVTQGRRDFPGWVRLGSGDPAAGYVIAQDLDRVDHEELAEDLGELSVYTMTQVEKALRMVLGL